MFYVYLLKSLKHAELYVGSTNNMKRRLIQHNNGEEISTKRYMPWTLIYCEAYTKKIDARLREKRLKYHGNAMKEVKKRIGFARKSAGSPSTTFIHSPINTQNTDGGHAVTKKQQQTGNKSGAGFTMIELLVTVSIFALVTSVLLANYPRFSSKILLENTAHAIGLSVRQAQTFGLNVHGVRVGGIDTFPTYGVHFSLQGVNEIDPADQKHFVLFADILKEPPDGDSDSTNNDKIYNAAQGCTTQGGECVDIFTIQSAERIVLLCGYLIDGGGDVEDCSLTALDVAFTRPNPDASIKGYSDVEGITKEFSYAKIIAESPRGDQKAVVVRNTGQITVE